MNILCYKPIMVGDWLIPSNSDKPDRVRSVSVHEDISGKWLTFTFDGPPGSLGSYHWADHCKPVQITPEILEKNFVKAGTRFVFRDGSLDMAILQVSADTYQLSFCDSKVPVSEGQFNVCAVHQIQQFLRYFESKKDIEL